MKDCLLHRFFRDTNRSNLQEWWHGSAMTELSVRDRRLRRLPGAEMKLESLRQAGSATGDQPKDECWRVLHVKRKEQTECPGEQS